MRGGGGPLFVNNVREANMRALRRSLAWLVLPAIVGAALANRVSNGRRRRYVRLMSRPAAAGPITRQMLASWSRAGRRTAR